MRLLPFGDDAWLVEVSDPVTGATSALPAAVAYRLRELTGVVQAVPGARSVLVEFDRAADSSALRAAVLAAAESPNRSTPDRPLVEISVTYDGDDLDEIVAATTLAVDEVVRRHTASEYRVAFCGFAPGFAYLTGLDPVLQLPRHAQPRHAQPRTAVPAGAVGIAGEFTGIYPRRSPGGWRLLGRTDATLWDAARTPPALLPPGTRVRFVAAGR
jgi:KipI family sensor histidine kinase inhibitor